jgi:hypothetical protein
MVKVGSWNKLEKLETTHLLIVSIWFLTGSPPMHDKMCISGKLSLYVASAKYFIVVLVCLANSRFNKIQILESF